MTETYSNYFENSLIKHKRNNDFFKGRNSFTDKSIVIDLECKLDCSQIAYESEVFAMSFSTHGEFNHAKVLQVRENQVYQTLKELYIYDKVKTLYNGYFNMYWDNTVNLGYSFKGNYSFQRLLVRPFNSNSSNENLFIKFSISTGYEEECKAKILRMIISFPFLREFLIKNGSNFGKTPFWIRSYETHFSRYYNGYYTIDYIQKGINNSDDTKLEDVGSDFKSSKKPDFTNGAISIMEANPTNTSNVLNWKSCPVLNSFLSKSKDTYFFIPVGDKHKIEYNNSLFFSKTFALSLVSSDDERMLEKEYYLTVRDTNKVKEVTVGSQVYCTTGIKGISLPIPSNKDLNFKIPSFEKIEELMSEYPNQFKLIEKIVEIIKRVNEDIDIDDIIDEYIGPKLK